MGYGMFRRKSELSGTGRVDPPSSMRIYLYHKPPADRNRSAENHCRSNHLDFDSTVRFGSDIVADDHGFHIEATVQFTSRCGRLRL
jgi:hypothetical protein